MKRYGIYWNGEYCYEEEEADGSWVSGDDALAIEAERDSLRAQLEAIRAMVRDCNGQQIVEVLTRMDMMGPDLRLGVILDAISATEPKRGGE